MHCGCLFDCLTQSFLTNKLVYKSVFLSCVVVLIITDKSPPSYHANRSSWSTLGACMSAALNCGVCLNEFSETALS